MIDCHVHPSPPTSRTATQHALDAAVALFTAAAAADAGRGTTARDVGGWNYVEMGFGRLSTAADSRAAALPRRLLSSTATVAYYPGMYEVADGLDMRRAAASSPTAPTDQGDGDWRHARRRPRTPGPSSTGATSCGRRGGPRQPGSSRRAHAPGHPQFAEAASTASSTAPQTTTPSPVSPAGTRRAHDPRGRALAATRRSPTPCPRLRQRMAEFNDLHLATIRRARGRCASPWAPMRGRQEYHALTAHECVLMSPAACRRPRASAPRRRTPRIPARSATSAASLGPTRTSSPAERPVEDIELTRLRSS
jgi:hypothetical protein